MRILLIILFFKLDSNDDHEANDWNNDENQELLKEIEDLKAKINSQSSELSKLSAEKDQSNDELKKVNEIATKLKEENKVIFN